MQYETIQELTPKQVELIISNGNVDEILYVPVSVSLYSDDWKYSQEICLRLGKHPNSNVRGNAILGFGHIARIHNRLDRDKVAVLVLDALQDSSDYVRGQADDAKDDINHWLGWGLE